MSTVRLGTAVRRAVFAALLATGAAAHAETLEQAWSLALSGDQGLAAATSEAEGARLELAAAKGGRLPVVMASGTYSKFQDAPAFDFSAAGLPFRLPELFDHDDLVMAGVNVELPLYTGGRITNQIAAAEAGGVAREAVADRTRADLRFGVAEAYVGVQRAERSLATARSGVESLAQYVRDVESMFNREVVPRNDLLSAQVALANAEQARLQAANAVELARAAYNRRLGQPLDRPFALEPIPAIATDVGNLPLAALEAEALDKRDEVVALKAQGEALGHAAAAEKSRLLPQVSLTGGYQYLENQALDRQEFAMVGVGMRWALFDGTVRDKSSSLRQTQRAAEQRLGELRSMIALEVRQSYLSLNEARARVDVARGAVDQAEENKRIADQQYAAGLVNSTRVLEAEALRVQSLANRENAIMDVELARLRLARATGRL